MTQEEKRNAVNELSMFLLNQCRIIAEDIGFVKRSASCEMSQNMSDASYCALNSPVQELAYGEVSLETAQHFVSVKPLPKVRRSPFTVVSLFAGCGGMDLGFKGGFTFLGKRYASHPFEIIWANEINGAACRTYRKNIGQHVREGDIWTMLDDLPTQADVVIGGFPCQDISVNGKGAGISGKRSGLYRAMVETVALVKPKIFVAENVKGLLMRPHAAALQKVLADFKALGYEVSYELYHAADYGVPQTRERVIIVGTLPEIKPFKPPTQTHDAQTYITAREALHDLVSMVEAAHINHIWSRASRSPEQGDRRLLADRPGYTIRAECHGNIQWHYNLPRRISMREAARIQSFPDNFIFDAKLRETERQIGNAVPPVLAWHIAKSVAKVLKSPVERR